jgi:hypothetical protein
MEQDSEGIAMAPVSMVMRRILTGWTRESSSTRPTVVMAIFTRTAINPVHPVLASMPT